MSRVTPPCDEPVMTTYLGVVTSVHPKVEWLDVSGLPVVAVNLIEPSHHVPLKLGLVLDGRHPTV